MLFVARLFLDLMAVDVVRGVMRRVMVVMGLAETLLAVEHQEVHAEGVEGGDEHAGQHREVESRPALG